MDIKTILVIIAVVVGGLYYYKNYYVGSSPTPNAVTVPTPVPATAFESEIVEQKPLHQGVEQLGNAVQTTMPTSMPAPVSSDP